MIAVRRQSCSSWLVRFLAVRFSGGLAEGVDDGSEGEQCSAEGGGGGFSQRVDECVADRSEGVVR